MNGGFTALVLAGSRGDIDGVAKYAGVAHKALVPVGGTPMILRVIAALQDAGASQIAVSTGEHELAALVRAAGCRVLPSESQPSLSVLAAFDVLGPPLLVTTSDHALLESDWVRQFLADTPGGFDLAVSLAERTLIEAAAPGGRRTYYRFADGSWSGCNLFCFATPKARAALQLWRRIELSRKQPWRVAWAIGPRLLLGYLLRRYTLQRAVARVGRSIGIKACAVPSRFGLSAVDVDTPADLDLVRALTGG